MHFSVWELTYCHRVYVWAHSCKTQLNKYVGSLLTRETLNWPHYAIPVYGPDKCAQDWTERNVSTYIDFQKLRDEMEFWKRTGTIQPLRERRLLYGDFIEMDNCFR